MKAQWGGGGGTGQHAAEGDRRRDQYAVLRGTGAVGEDMRDGGQNAAGGEGRVG